jgi:excinuclease ABC subunit C
MSPEVPAGPGDELPGFLPASRLAALKGSPLRAGPTTPGVYLFRDAEGAVQYIGKARSLRRRVLDHLHVGVEKDGSILERSRSVEFVPTESEREALLLEASLVKQYQPPYNTLLKDDKSYPYLAVTVGEEWPRILLVRNPKRNRQQALFGPYVSAREARSVQKLLSETFQLRQCFRLPPRACLYYHIKTCSGPCIGAVAPDDYGRDVRRAIEVLRGDTRSVRPALEAEMTAAVKREEFERASILRDALRGLEALSEPQHVVGTGTKIVDVIALVYPRDPGVLEVAVGLLRLEEGEVRATEPHLLGIPAADPPEAGELLKQFLLQYYGARIELPKRIVIAGPAPAGADEAIEWLAEKGIPVKFRPTGRYASLARLAERQARSHLESHGPPRTPKEAMVALQDLLKLPTLPRRIEGIDISILQGFEAVGSLVVFQNGRPAKDEYRKFKIRTVEGMNDFAMVHEVVSRRFLRRIAEDEILPDLLLIDGGAGQLAAAEAALRELNAADRIPAIGLAKREEEIYLPAEPIPLRPNPNSAPVLLLRAVRDEAHRFAVTYHRKRRSIRLREEVARATPEPDASRRPPPAAPSPAPSPGP